MNDAFGVGGFQGVGNLNTEVKDFVDPLRREPSPDHPLLPS